MNMRKMIAGLKKGQKMLNAARVMPLGILITKEKWHYYKYKALPGHKNPGNAGKGFSHPQMQGGKDYSELLKLTRSPREENLENIINVNWADDESWKNLVKPIIGAIEWPEKDVVAYYSRYEDGTLSSIDIARGGIVVWEDFPSDMADVGTKKEKSRISKIRKEEKTKTDKYVHEYLSAIGKRGGSAKSEAKQAASRENGKLGGRPRTEKK